MISGSLCENCSSPVPQTAAGSLLPLGQLPPAPTAAAMTQRHPGPYAVPGKGVAGRFGGVMAVLHRQLSENGGHAG